MFTWGLLLLIFHYTVAGRPRGVPVSKASFYVEADRFTCIDGLASIPYSYLNDDYCDCIDGSDEPGTSACPNASFHCSNVGYKPHYITSSRVNDGLCDCCDGADEYTSGAVCVNTCRELGRILQEEREEKKRLSEAGHEQYLEYIRQSADDKAKKEAELSILEAEIVEIKKQRDEAEEVKKGREEPEKEAKDKHEKDWQVEKERRLAEREHTSITAAFNDLDKNSDGKVSIEEIEQHLEFDIDSNGQVSYEEAKEYLEDNDFVEVQVFVEKVWPNMKDIYKATPATPTQTEEIVTETPVEGAEEADEAVDHGDHEKQKETSQPEETMPPYDANTQLLIDAANEARDRFNQLDSKHKESEQKINDIRKDLTTDFGLRREFWPLKGQCYEYTDREYTYKLCPFDRSTQRGKHGGGETSLGTWGSWAGDGDDIYSAMRYERGQNCWNGPDRSTKVILECGSNNQVTSASEPNRCEYEFKMFTPAACKNPQLAIDEIKHEEL